MLSFINLSGLNLILYFTYMIQQLLASYVEYPSISLYSKARRLFLLKNTDIEIFHRSLCAVNTSRDFCIDDSILICTILNKSRCTKFQAKIYKKTLYLSV